MIPKIKKSPTGWAKMGYKYTVYNHKGTGIMVHSFKDALKRWWWFITFQY